MGRFSAIVLFLAAVGCGDNQVIDDPHAGAAQGVTPGGAGVATPRYLPEVCGVEAWSPMISSDPASILAVATRTDGAAVLAVPRATGQLQGFAVDGRMDMTVSGAKLITDQTLSSVSATTIDNRLVAAAAMSDAVYVNLVADDLSATTPIAKLPAGYIAKPAMFHADGPRIVPVADAAGLTVHQFDDQWNVVASQQLLATKPATGMTATAYGVATLATWSTPSECYTMQIAGFAPGPYARMDIPCTNPRIAADIANDQAAIVYDAPDGVRLTWSSHVLMTGGSQLLRSGATSPRIVFDGTRYWVSYLDPRGDVVVGYLDGGRLVSTSLIGPLPEPDAYELVMLEGSPWVFSLDATAGWTGHRLCMIQTN